MLGTALRLAAQEQGHTVLSLVRREALSPYEISWDPAGGRLDPAALDGADAVVNFSGTPILQPPRRWTSSFLEELHASRLGPTRTLVTAMHQASQPPATFLSQSGKDYYGCGGPYDESGPGPATQDATVLSSLCRLWEAEAGQAPKPTRTVVMRTGVVFSPRGGALAKLLTPLRWGLGGTLGDGAQHWPWITLPDLTAAILFLLGQSPAACESKEPTLISGAGAALSGPVNFCAPEAATVNHIVRALGSALHRPTVLRVPAFALRIGLGRAADEVLLSDTVTVPAALTGAGFRFRYPDISSAASWIAAELRHKVR